LGHAHRIPQKVPRHGSLRDGISRLSEQRQEKWEGEDNRRLVHWHSCPNDFTITKTKNSHKKEREREKRKSHSEPRFFRDERDLVGFVHANHEALRGLGGVGGKGRSRTGGPPARLG